MIYNRTTWENSPSTSTPINAQNLNKIEQGISDAATELNGLQPHLSNVGIEIDEDYKVNVLHSRNLLPNNSSTTTTNGITFTKNSDGSITINGTSTARADLYVFGGATDNGNYFKIKKGTYSFDRSNLTDGRMFFAFREKTAGTKYETLTNNGAIETMATQDCYFYGVMIGVESGYTINNLTIYPMLNEGSEALPYEPYMQNQIVVDNEKYSDTLNVGSLVDGKSRVNFIHSRNLFDASIQAGTYGSATYSVASDGLITQSATDSSSMPASDKRNFKLKKGTYTASIIGKPSNVNFQMRNITTSSNVFEGVNNSYTFTLTDDSYVAIKCWSASATYPINYYIMLVEGSRALDYEPYNISNQIVVDGETFSETIKIGNEVDGKSRVNIIHSRNLFNKNSVNALNAYFVDGTNNITADTSGNNKTIYIPCKPNTTYTIQKTASPSNRAIGYTTTTPAVGVAVQGAINISANTTTGHITTGNNAQYLVIRVWSSSQDTITYDQMIASVQIEEGTTATPYKPFTTNEINIDNETFTDTLKVGTDVDNRSRVNIIRQVNNILPKGTIYTLTDGSVSLNFKVPKANTQYTMKTNLPETDGLALVFFGSGADAQVNSATNGVWVGSPRTMTSDANGYVTIAFRYLSGYSSIKLGDYWYTLAEGTLGVDYIVPSINVDGEEIYSKGVTLYNGGTTGSDLSSPISFSDSLANYERIEIYYGTSRPYYISTFYSNYGQHQYFEPSLQFYYLNNADSSFYIYITLLTISQSAMELHSSRGSRTVTISSNGTITNTKSTTSSPIKIYKVIGYK